jgi:hypothetical protein
VCDLETSRICAPYIYDISNLRVSTLVIKFKPGQGSDVCVCVCLCVCVCVLYALTMGQRIVLIGMESW